MGAIKYKSPKGASCVLGSKRAKIALLSFKFHGGKYGDCVFHIAKID